MIDIHHEGHHRRDHLPRREWLSLGALSAVGLSLPDYLSAREQAETTGGRSARAASCIQIFLWGGPGAQETWDLKPAAPEASRGEFQPISTTLPGVQFCQHLPRLAERAHQYTIVRSATHDGVNHGTSAYHMLTGHIHWSPGTLRHPTKKDMPNLGCNAGRFLPHPAHLPAHVQLPAIINDGDNLPVPGQWGGILGDRHDPFKVLGDVTKPDFQVSSLALAEGVVRERLSRRVGLQQALETHRDHLRTTAAGLDINGKYERALSLLQSVETERAFDLSQEPQATRERYGIHYFGQSLLLARRLVEAGVPFVTVYWNPPEMVYNFDEESWDTHKDQHNRMRTYLLPHFDAGLAALLDDLDDRGLFDQTLVTWWGEFGRTPKINGNGGRDHWGFCQSVGLAGGGIRRGLVYGSSTPDGGYPETDPVRPDDLAATMFHLLGIEHTQHMYDLASRPIPLSYGEPVSELLA